MKPWILNNLLTHFIKKIWHIQGNFEQNERALRFTITEKLVNMMLLSIKKKMDLGIIKTIVLIMEKQA